jgi:hypothetical protein
MTSKVKVVTYRLDKAIFFIEESKVERTPDSEKTTDKVEEIIQEEIINLLINTAKSAYFEFNNVARGNVFTHAAFILQRDWKLDLSPDTAQ